jgi:hypothetical protein
MSILETVAEMVAAVGEASDQLDVWSQVAPLLKSVGARVGIAAETLDAIDESHTLNEFFKNEITRIGAVVISDAVTTMLGAGLVEISSGVPGPALFVTGEALGVAVVATDLSAVLSVAGLAAVIYSFGLVVSSKIACRTRRRSNSAPAFSRGKSNSRKTNMAMSS